MIVAEGLLHGAWLSVWLTIALFVKVLAHGTFVSTSLGTLTAG